MAGPTRASVFETEDNSNVSLDVSGFAPRSAAQPATRPEQVRAVAEAARFQSREPRGGPPPPVGKRVPRRYRTGRNIQLNIKARADAIEAFYAVADQRGWVLGETFERAIEALKRELTSVDSK
jgi:hypothetical protein